MDDESSTEINREIVWKPISKGRSLIEQEIFVKAKEELSQLGIELLDIRFKRFNYRPEVSRQIYTRMTTERQAIAAEYRADGKGEGVNSTGASASGSFPVPEAMSQDRVFVPNTFRNERYFRQDK